MLRRWCIPLAGLGLLLGSAIAAAGPAAAAPATGHAALIRPAVQLIRPTGHGTRPLVAHGGPANAASSTNWSGYAAASGTYTSVSANWTEPTGTCSGSAKYSSFWVGLDGYNSSTVEQTGSEVDCSGSTPEYYSWYEMYPAYPVNFSNAVSPGDQFYGSVTFNGGSSYTLVLKDTDQGLEPHGQRDAGRARPIPPPRSSPRRRAVRPVAASCRWPTSARSRSPTPRWTGRRSATPARRRSSWWTVRAAPRTRSPRSAAGTASQRTWLRAN